MDTNNILLPLEELKSPHVSVLVDEVLSHLNIKEGGIYLDATFGAGGHSRAILESNSSCQVIALDWDKESLEKYSLPLLEEYPERFSTLWGSFAQLYKLSKRFDIASLDGILADFGTSQMQIAQVDGFSLYRNAPLDMRMSQSHQSLTAAVVIAHASERELADIFFEFGEERYSRRIARAIVEDRAKWSITTTVQLADLVKRVVPRNVKQTIHPATRVFQALRIYINHELDNIHAFLPVAFDLLAPQGRLVCISFHSLEDRIVKNFFRDCDTNKQGKVLTKKVVTASPEELRRNKSSRSAKLRSLEKLI